MALSRDLRLRIVGKVAEGMSRRQAGAHFGVSERSATRFAKRYERQGMWRRGLARRANGGSIHTQTRSGHGSGTGRISL